jgi:hypothetical protein
MIRAIQIVYEFDAAEVSLYNIYSEIDEPESVLEYEGAWSGARLLRGVKALYLWSIHWLRQ